MSLFLAEGSAGGTDSSAAAFAVQWPFFLVCVVRAVGVCIVPVAQSSIVVESTSCFRLFFFWEFLVCEVGGGGWLSLTQL